MEKELFACTEGKLYRYYESKKKIYKLKESIRWLEDKMQRIEYDIKHANVSIDYYQNGMGISERVQSTSSGTSYAENEICRAIDLLEREHVDVNKKLLKTRMKLREVEEYIMHMDTNINSLNEEDRRFIELKYGDKANILIISRKLNIAQATAYRKREELVECIAEFENTFLINK